MTPEHLALLGEYGFTASQIHSIATRAPAIRAQPITRAKTALANLEHHGLTREEIRDVVRRAPLLLTFTTERTAAYVEIMRDAGVSLVNLPALVLFAPKLLRARITFLADSRMEPTLNRLKLTNAGFERKLGIAREELLRRYGPKET